MAKKVVNLWMNPIHKAGYILIVFILVNPKYSLTLNHPKAQFVHSNQKSKKKNQNNFS
jgi:hypothetical protein